MTAPADPPVTALPFRALPQELVTNLERAPYQYAYTMPGIPHYYTLKRKWEEDERFVWTVSEMRRHEVVRKFYSRDQRYLDVNGFMYWTMGDPLDQVTLVNRHYRWYEEAAPFDRIAHRYDRPFGEPPALREEHKHFAALANPSGRVLDIGCGTGMLADYRYKYIDRAGYVGIDPSFGMLAKFALKHPDYEAEATLLRTSFEEYETPLRFDTIVAMSGSASHVTGADITAKVRHLLAPGGRAFLTFYRHPAKSCERLGIPVPRKLAAVPDGAVADGDYYVVGFVREGEDR